MLFRVYAALLTQSDLMRQYNVLLHINLQFICGTAGLRNVLLFQTNASFFYNVP